MYCIHLSIYILCISNKTSPAQTPRQLVVAKNHQHQKHLSRSVLWDMMSAMALAANKVREAMRQVGQAWQPCTLGETKDVVEVTNHWEGKTNQVET